MHYALVYSISPFLFIPPSLCSVSLFLLSLLVDLYSLLFFFLKLTFSFFFSFFFFFVFYFVFFFVPPPPLRQEQEVTHRNLFLGADFISFLIESFSPFPVTPLDLPVKKAAARDVNRYVARGLIMNCANAIRLQVSTFFFSPHFFLFFYCFCYCVFRYQFSV